MAAPSPPSPAPSTWGRFTLLGLLGQGEQSRTWLAQDPQRNREVVLKLPVRIPGTDASLVTRWVQQARRVSLLRHPHIVPVLEADVLDQQPYRVSAYTPGQTLLSDLLAQHAPRSPAQAVVLALDMLDALASAHAAGLLHRNVKPSNVLVDASGRAQLMDFGTSLQTGGVSAYLSPEAAQGQPATPQTDVFAVGLVLAEMLAGQPLVDTRDAARAQYRLSHEQLVLPPGAEADDGLRHIVAHALAYAPAQRYADVPAFRAALMAWSPSAHGAHSAAAAPQASAPAAPNPLDALLERMHRQGEFPAMASVVARIQGLASSETESLDSVAHEIMKDVALTNKLLRLVNSAHFGAREGHISTVSRAVNLVGFNGIRNLTLSLVLLEQMQDQSHAHVLKDEFLRCLMAGCIAVELCTVGRESEETFIGAMFQNLGRILAEYYFPDEARTVRGLLASTRQPMAETAAAASVLGVGYEALGLAMAQSWSLPESIQRCMRKPRGEPPIVPPVLADERLRWTSMAANEMADILLRAPAAGLVARLEHVQRYYARVLGLSPEDARKATQQARRKLIAMAHSMALAVVPGSGAAQLLQAPEDDAKAAADKDRPPPPPPARPLADALTVGLHQLRHAMQGDYKPADVLRMALASLREALQCQRVVFCMRDPKTDTLTGRFGLGEGAESAAKAFSIPLKSSPPDLFTTVCLKGADTLIHDALEPRMATRLPAWYRTHLRAPCFLLLPLHIQGKPIGLVYADSADKTGLALSDTEMALLRSLRDQMLLAFKQAPA
jgi:HD-like signal output (HDOD) protein